MNVGTALLIFLLAVLFGRWHRRLPLHQLSIMVAALAAAGVASWAVITRHHSPDAIATVTSFAFAVVLLVMLLSFAARCWTPDPR